jgi:hypothetical protein
MLSGRLQGFIPRELAHFQDHVLTLHTAFTFRCRSRHEPDFGAEFVEVV